METIEILPSWLDPYLEDVEALARVEGQMPSKRRVREFFAEFEEEIHHDKGADTDELWTTMSDRWWRRFSDLEIKRARRAARLHLRLNGLYEALKTASDEDVAAYAQFREQARASEARQLWTDLLKRRTDPL